MGSRLIAVGLTMVLMMICGGRDVGATVYTVGDSSGWTVGGDYTTWPADKSFAVGDNLVFNYAAGHTVDEVGQNDYTSCTAGNSISSDSSGATTIALKTAGPHYFICSSPGHCSGGMKLAVTVAAAASGGAGGGTTTSPGGPSATTSPPTTTSPGVAAPRTGTSTQSSSTAALSPAMAAILGLFAAVFKGLFF